jgi:hypothetical protein
MSELLLPSGSAAGDACVSSSPLAADADAALFVGRRVVRLTRSRRGDAADGVVVSHGVIPGVGPMWCVQYGGEGGPREEVERAQLDAMLLPLGAMPAEGKHKRKRVAPPSPPSPSEHRYKGVSWNARREKWDVWIRVRGVHTYICCFERDEAVEAAHAYDDAMRKAGGTSFNFPREGEEQATSRRSHGGAAAAGSGAVSKRRRDCRAAANGRRAQTQARHVSAAAGVAACCRERAYNAALAAVAACTALQRRELAYANRDVDGVGPIEWSEHICWLLQARASG